MLLRQHSDQPVFVGGIIDWYIALFSPSPSFGFKPSVYNHQVAAVDQGPYGTWITLSYMVMSTFCTFFSGKTCLLIVFSKDQFPDVYVPTVFENYVADIEVDGKQVGLFMPTIQKISFVLTSHFFLLWYNFSMFYYVSRYCLAGFGRMRCAFKNVLQLMVTEKL